MNVYEFCFSPTGGTKKVSGFLAGELCDDFIAVDLSDHKADFSAVSLADDDVAVIAVPSYSGRVPSPAVERIAAVKANGAKAILVCVYGNRAYEDTLAELQDVAEGAGFRVVAAVAAVAEHSIVHKYAANRPDGSDYRLLGDFAASIRRKLDVNDFSVPPVPGGRPYRKAGKVGIVPKASGKCTGCGLCASVCPVGAIDKDNPSRVDKGACISCMRCVSVCPHGARKVNGLLIAVAGLMLRKSCSVRKACELYI